MNDQQFLTFLYHDKENAGKLVTFVGANEDSFHRLTQGGAIQLDSAVLRFEGPIDRPICEEDPTSRFFESWELDCKTNPTKVVVNVADAYEDWKESLLIQRNERLVYLDSLQVQAMGQQDAAEIERIENIKQALRELPLVLEAKQPITVQDIFNIVPVVLLAE